MSDRAGGDNLWIMNADGSNPRTVTDEAEHLVHNPAWSPDGEYLVGRKGYYSTRSIAAGEALRGATIDGAASLGMDEHIGSLEAGKLADIMIVDGKPLTDISRSGYVSHTMINGRLFEAASMNQIAPDKVARQPLYFELEGGDAWSTTARQSFEQKARALHWHH